MASGGEWQAEQLKELNLSFDKADTDKSGALSIMEVHTVLKESGFTGSRADCNKIFFGMDENKDFKVSREEFNKAIGKLPNASRREMALMRDFKRIDKDGSGSLTRGELMAASFNLDTSLSRDTIKKIVSETYSDDDGEIQYDEFLRILNFAESESMLNKTFAKLDTDGSGEISLDEMWEAVKSEGELARLRPQILRLLESQAKDFEGKKMDFHRFVTLWLQQKDDILAKAEDSPYI
ncbi:hypothetical protein EGW08_004637 [Elysia chlorotica]|uniref:EF-hand domain-containing protein n=1 Tax=Elysia chlorotica TaxID=188477 RepID=A0A3S1BN90_ELYCH|nr:hypothetical protein EGW08_004637 [Elysia chlorotica]